MIALPISFQKPKLTVIDTQPALNSSQKLVMQWVPTGKDYPKLEARWIAADNTLSHQ